MRSNDGRGDPLCAHPAGEPWSVWRWLEVDRSWSSTFYVNLEQPWIRTPIGYDSHDWILDLVVQLNPFHATWKDVDELEWSVQAGVISGATANDIHTAGRRALRSAEAHEWPFDADWDQWLPGDDGPVPQLDPRWRELALADRG
jgi:predicted RNA-binding protein associated with RNAse of E/G family